MAAALDDLDGDEARERDAWSSAVGSMVETLHITSDQVIVLWPGGRAAGPLRARGSTLHGDQAERRERQEREVEQADGPARRPRAARRDRLPDHGGAATKTARFTYMRTPELVLVGIEVCAPHPWREG